MTGHAIQGRAAKIEEARGLRAQGFGWKRTARALGVSETTVRRWLKPGFEERLLLTSREAKWRRRGTCEDCGAETRYSGRDGRTVSTLCHPCAVIRSGLERRYTKAELLAALRQYKQETGLDPRSHVWIDEKRQPSLNVFYRYFGSWKAAVLAAGFEPGKAGRKGKVAA